MNITQVKSELNTTSLPFAYSRDKETQKIKNEEWLSCRVELEDKTPIQVSIHKDTAAKIKADAELNSLGIQYDVLKSDDERPDLKTARIVAYNVDLSL